MAKKPVKINLTEQSAPMAGDAPWTEESGEPVTPERIEAAIQNAPQADPESKLLSEVMPEDASETAQIVTSISVEAAHESNPAYLGLAESAGEIIRSAFETDQSDNWNRVADLLYKLEQIKHKLPGLRASRLMRLLERLP